MTWWLQQVGRPLVFLRSSQLEWPLGLCTGAGGPPLFRARLRDAPQALSGGAEGVPGDQKWVPEAPSGRAEVVLFLQKVRFGVAFRNVFHGNDPGVVSQGRIHAVAESNSEQRARKFPIQMRCGRGASRQWVPDARGGLRASGARRCVLRPNPQSCIKQFEARRRKVLQPHPMQSGRSLPLALVTLYSHKGP